MSALSPNAKKSLPYSSNSSVTTQPVVKTEYAKAAYRWNRENYSRTRRRLDIWRFVWLLLSKFWLNGKKWSYLGYTEEKRAARRKIQGVWIRENLLALGPTFIKVG